MKQYYIYFLTNKNNNVLYIGVTGDLVKRIWEHRNKLIDGFTKKYNCTKLVYYEHTESINSAIEREKQLKGWLRKKKNGLVEKINPKWEDLSKEFLD